MKRLVRWFQADGESDATAVWRILIGVTVYMTVGTALGTGIAALLGWV